eukprot:1614021-Rhodomonas_salina.1
MSHAAARGDGACDGAGHVHGGGGGVGRRLGGAHGAGDGAGGGEAAATHAVEPARGPPRSLALAAGQGPRLARQGPALPDAQRPAWLAFQRVLSRRGAVRCLVLKEKVRARAVTRVGASRSLLEELRALGKLHSLLLSNSKAAGAAEIQQLLLRLQQCGGEQPGFGGFQVRGMVEGYWWSCRINLWMVLASLCSSLTLAPASRSRRSRSASSSSSSTKACKRVW